MSGVDNMDYMYSVNANNGEMTLNVNFALGTNANTDQLLAQMRSGHGDDEIGRAHAGPGSARAAPATGSRSSSETQNASGSSARTGTL